MTFTFQIEVEASGTVRKCEPWQPISVCPSCNAKGQHASEKKDDTFTQRTCGNCSTQWREFNPTESEQP